MDQFMVLRLRMHNHIRRVASQDIFALLLGNEGEGV